MSRPSRSALAALLLLIAAGAAYQAVAALELDAAGRRGYWTFDALVGVPCALTAVWLLWPRMSRA